MMVNPEFQRYLWLKFSPSRLVLAPVVILLIALFFTGFDIMDDKTGKWAKDLFYPVIVIYYIVVFIWGNYEASSAFPDEVTNKTWDFQKMSSLSTSKLVIGKVFGSTSYVWYVGALLLGLAFITINHLPSFVPPISSQIQPVMKEIPSYKLQHIAMSDSINYIALLFLAGIMGHLAAFLGSILIYHQNGKGNSRISFIFGLIVSQIIFAIAPIKPNDIESFSKNNIDWFMFDIEPIIFFYASILFFGLWFLIGGIQLIRKEMKYFDMPFSWLFFTFSINIYLLGLVFADSDMKLLIFTNIIFAMGLMMLGWTYISMMTESNNLQLYKRFLHYIRIKDYTKLSQNAPRWLVTLLISMLCFVVFLVITGINGKEWWLGAFAFILSSFLFVLRDGLVLHTLRLGQSASRSTFSVGAYYLLMYVLLPGLFLLTNLNDMYDLVSDVLKSTISGDDSKTASQMGFKYSLFFPSVSMVYTLPIIAQCVFCLSLLNWRLKKLHA